MLDIQTEKRSKQQWECTWNHDLVASKRAALMSRGWLSEAAGVVQTLDSS